MAILSMLREIIPDMEFQIETSESLLKNELHLVGKLGMFNRQHSFTILAASERMIKVTGFNIPPDGYGERPVSKPKHLIVARSAGYMQLTPVMYLTSNIGTTVHSYIDKDMVNQKILMRINNHFISGTPIVCNNFEFTSKIPSNALTDCWFRLVDANFMPVKLLAPMYLSAIAIGIKDNTIERPVFIDEDSSLKE
jgi:hypothetical protein